jgi:cell division protein FtsB
MAKTRNNQSPVIRFVPALKAAFLCLVITGSAVGYVWQKGEIEHLGRQKHQREEQLQKLTLNNQRLGDQIAILHSPIMLDQRMKELNSGLVPLVPSQVVHLMEPALTPAPGESGQRKLAERPDNY